jgi:hypothetical protein
MRVLGYRDLAMAFIPFFGGVAMGLAIRPRGTHEIVVALLGPLPGLAIGLLLALGARAWGLDVLARWSVAFAVINGLNLLPLYPLDGGRVVQELVCRRQPALALLMKLAAAFSLAGLAIYTLSFAPALLAVAILVCLRSDYTHARLGQRYHRLAGRCHDPDRAIPEEYVRAVLPAVRRRSRHLANQADHVAEEIVELWQYSAHVPPARLASLGLFVVYLGGVALAMASGLLGLMAANA